MHVTRRGWRWTRLTITVLIVVGAAVGHTISVTADEKLGETAINQTLEELARGYAEEEPPPPEAEASSDPGGQESAEVPSDLEPAPSEPEAEAVQPETAPADEVAAVPVEEAQAASDGADESLVSAEQSAAESIAPEGGTGTAIDPVNDGTDGVAQAAIDNVLSGAPALGIAEAPVVGGLPEDDPQPRGQNSQRPGGNLRESANNLRPASFAPVGNLRGSGGGSTDGGTVVVNNLIDGEDQGKVAVHGHIVAGTLCDGSQFWSLDGGGTVVANGVTLSANGGTAGTDATGGQGNAAESGGAAGNGGQAHASADGGIVVVDELVTGTNRGNQVSVGGTNYTGDCGRSVIHGGDVTTTTDITISADGGTALADASGGDNNVASGRGSAAGNGGTAHASADGGIVIVGSLVVGNNEGNTITSGSGGSGSTCLGAIDGGSVANDATIDIGADGGVAIADASGGDNNLAIDGGTAGNGGFARANADGGMILAGDITTGNNSGNTINAGCGGGSGLAGSGGESLVYGGDISNQTTITLNADGGTAIADASGGSGNIAAGSEAGQGSAGNGGRARSDASGGLIMAGQIVTGNNVGNVIAFGVDLQPVPPRDRERRSTTAGQRPGRERAAGAKTPRQGSRTISSQRPAKASVANLPDTGTGSATPSSINFGYLLALGFLSVLGAAVAILPAARRWSPTTLPTKSSSRLVRS